ncbi:hypothetical protein BV22DRAFT_1042386 [Leucogyrophana mollusca]|uniref:Uncharacterized protein n=1 Tax=Leucogyrophana mollusca TaxID=85980 RepID=A0ACB8AV49_9AGAM|nr:hypothetical protein BV22DRAFT_1042386 [Leucogyrophana mollusca]
MFTTRLLEAKWGCILKDVADVKQSSRALTSRQDEFNDEIEISLSDNELGGRGGQRAGCSFVFNTIGIGTSLIL